MTMSVSSIRQRHGWDKFVRPSTVEHDVMLVQISVLENNEVLVDDLLCIRDTELIPKIHS